MRRRQAAPRDWTARCRDPEDGKGVRRLPLVDQLPAWLDRAVDPAGELDGLLAAPGPDDHVRERARDVVALAPELFGEVVGLPEAVRLDPHLPRRVTPSQELLLHVRLLGVVVPALLVAEPTLGHEAGRCQPQVGQLALDDAGRLLGLHTGSRVDEHRVAVLRPREPVLAQLVGELLRAALPQPEPAEQVLRTSLVRKLDSNPPVVVRHAGSLLSCGSRHRNVPVPGTGTFCGSPHALRRWPLLR